MDSFLFVLSTTLMYSAPLIFGALGGVVSESSGVINIGIEGIMSMGAFVAASVAYFAGDPWLGFIAGGIAGGVLSVLHAVASIFLKADQTISGVAINFIGSGLSIFLCGLFFDGKNVTTSIKNKLPKIFNNSNFSVDVTVLISFLLAILIWFVFYKTKWGLRIRAVGEHPATADSLGINVRGIRSCCVILSGFLSGLGGSAVTLAIVSQFSPFCISGQGFMALAAVIFGKWKPLNAYLACVFFGFSQVLSIVFNGPESIFPSVILNTLPYIFTIAVLIIFVGKSIPPKANGISYEKEV
ncbi:MAG: ABC transporter permease [Oscillospiraceae bacterium]|jgi:simple sugar transport system permease protein|nr:ABC transporter permease [Oscillospiraceae bacterium]